MRMKKYEITDIAHPDNPKLHRIRALTDVGTDVHKGDLGGFVETEDNLDQEGFAWIGKDAQLQEIISLWHKIPGEARGSAYVMIKGMLIAAQQLPQK